MSASEDFIDLDSAEPSQTPSAESDAARVLSPGERVGKLRIIDYVASGGMAEIYTGIHEELEVIRAIKILKPGFTAEDKARFQTEAKISAHLHHPNIIQIYTVDLWMQMLPYIEMEYVEGSSLAQLCAEHRRLPADFCLAVCSIVCDALQYAQGRTFTLYGKIYTGLVHRDVKPANILLSRDGTVKLGDFGIALPGNVSIHTVGPNTMGTYAYLSPEQLDGEQLDQRSDIYSLGIVLYETIAGFKAFPDQVLPELIRNKLSGTYRPLQALVPDVPKSLTKAIDRCLALDRKKRFNDVADLRTSLRRVLEELTDQEPAQVVSDFLQHPIKDTQELRGRRFSMFSSGWLVPMLAGGAVLAFVVAAIIVKNSLTLDEIDDAPPRVTTQARQEPLPAPPQTADKQSVTGKSESAATAPEPSGRERTPAPLSGTPAQQENLPVRQTRTVPKLSTPVAQAEDQVEEPFIMSHPAHEQTAHSHVQALESFIVAGNYEQAIVYARKHPVDDGHYHFLRGRALHEAGEYAAAENALNRAQTTRSRYADETKRSATFLWAKNRSAMYRKKPNLRNRTIALKAWKNYRRVFCKEGSNDSACKKAEEAVGELER